MDLGNAKAIEISDKPIFDKYFKKFPPEISELTFTNLFMWRKHYNFSFLEWKDHLLIFSKSFLNSKWTRPKVPGSNAIYFLPPIGENPELIIINIEKTNSIS